MNKYGGIKQFEKHDSFPWTADVPENPFLHGAYGPVIREIESENLQVVEGEIPQDLNGVYLRNGPNPRFKKSSGMHHYFDGDGMLHALILRDGKASYRNRWIQTEHFQMETQAQQLLWPGYADARPVEGQPPGVGSDGTLKDASNTDVKWFNGAAITTFYQAGQLYRVNPVSLDTLGAETLHDRLPHQISAHKKVDDSTGEMMFFDYSMKQPYLSYGVASSTGRLTNYVEIPLPGPRLPHDMAISKNYSILHDLPLYWDPQLIKRGVHKLSFFRDQPARFAIIPRHGNTSQIKWFEAKPCYIYHTSNAYEDGDWLIMDGCRMPDPYPARRPGDTSIDRLVAITNIGAAQMYRWKFNLKTGETRESQIDDCRTEFPMINSDDYLGVKYRYCYNVLVPDETLVRFSGLVKYDVETGKREEFDFGNAIAGSECPFAPRDNAMGEDDGYLLTFVTSNDTGQSQALIFDAKQISDGPVCRLRIPQRVPAGFHACWVNAKKSFGK